MRHRLIPALFLALLLGVPAPSYAAPCDAPLDICDDINDVSNGWNDIANMLEMGEDEDLADLDIDQFNEDVATMMEATALLGAVLVEEGNEDEQELGATLLDVIADAGDMAAEDMQDYIVDILDDLVDALDAIVDYCDQQ